MINIIKIVNSKAQQPLIIYRCDKWWCYDSSVYLAVDKLGDSIDTLVKSYQNIKKKLVLTAFLPDRFLFVKISQRYAEKLVKMGCLLKKQLAWFDSQST